MNGRRGGELAAVCPTDSDEVQGKVQVTSGGPRGLRATKSYDGRESRLGGMDIAPATCEAAALSLLPAAIAMASAPSGGVRARS
jgi:hypothetical protein